MSRHVSAGLPARLLRLAAALVFVSCGGSGTEPPPPPTVTAISPASGAQGATVTIAITGSNFTTNGTTVSVSGDGITVSGVTVSSPASATAQLAIDAAATPGARTVSLHTGGGTATATFTVVVPVPTLVSLNPATVVQASSVVDTIVGTNFVAGATTVSVDGTGIKVLSATVQTPISIVAVLIVDDTAELTPRHVTVTTPGGTSNALALTVKPPVPTLTSITPNAGAAGTTANVTLTGSHFIPGATTVNVSGAGVTVSGVTVTAGGDTLKATFTIQSGAGTSIRNVTVTTAGGTSAAVSFSVGAPAPQIGSFTATPDTVGQGSASTLAWSGILNAIVCSIDNGIGTVNCAGGSITVRPTANTAYTFTAQGTGGTATASAHVAVVVPPAITSFAASATTVTSVQPVRLTWSSTYATSCAIDNGVGTVPCQGSTLVTPGTSRTYTLTAANGGATSTAAIAITAGAPSRYVYTANMSGSVEMFSIGTGGTLSTIGAGSVAPAAAPFGVAVDPAGKYAFVTVFGNNTVQAYTIGATGALVANGAAIAAGTGPRRAVVDPSGRFLFVENQTSQTVSAYTIGATGQLTANGTIATGAQPVDIAVDPLGRFVYVVNYSDDDVSEYAIAANGTLSAIGTAAAAFPTGIATDPIGRNVYVTNRSAGTISIFTINTSGTLLSLGTVAAGAGPTGIVVDPTGRYLYATDVGANTVLMYRINPTAGELIANGTVAAGTGPTAVTVDLAGRYVYVVNLVSSTLQAYTVNSDGTLTSLGTVPIALSSESATTAR